MFNDKRAYAHKESEIVGREPQQRLDLLAQAVSTPSKRAVVYNPLPWQRSGMVEVAGKFVFVNLYNNEWNTNFPEWIDGSGTSRVRLWPTPDLTVPSWAARLPLLAAAADGPAGKLPATQAGLTVSRPGTLVTAFGRNPDGDGTILRVWEQAGAAGDLTVTIPGTFTTATPVNLRGEKAGKSIPLAAQDGNKSLTDMDAETSV